jgi:hypothetical protein
MNELAAQVRGLLEHLSASSTAAVTSEVLESYRVDRVSCSTPELLNELKSVAGELVRAQLGSVRLFGEVEEEIDLATATLDRVRDDRLTVIFEKPITDKWAVFYTEHGFISALSGDVLSRRVVWVAADFTEFATYSTLICRWGGPREFDWPKNELESPRKLVRDRTHYKTPAEIAPWLLARPPRRSSESFEGWRREAIQQLSFCLPFEIIKAENGGTQVVLKGPRSTSIRVAVALAVQEDTVFTILNEAALWVYSGQRDAESKFTFLNYHLSLDWKDEDPWPLGAVGTLPASLASARDAFSFHLQDESRDALRSLSDLRRALQDEVAKVQQASRDLLSALWRDFAIAAGVIAIRYVPGMSSIPPEWLKVITLGSAALLLVSLVVSLWSNARYHRLARKSREDWRMRLYAFIDEAEWKRLVIEPIRSGLYTYRLVTLAISLLYIAIIIYLLYIGGSLNLLHKLVNFLRFGHSA